MKDKFRARLVSEIDKVKQAIDTDAGDEDSFVRQVGFWQGLKAALQFYNERENDAEFFEKEPDISEDTCPTCGEPATDQDRCPFGKVYCAHGHAWRYKPVNEHFTVPGDHRMHTRLVGYRKIKEE